jgi:hypothetical protein
MSAYLVARDGITRARFNTEAEAWRYLLNVQGQSIDWACTWEGWALIGPGDGFYGCDDCGKVTRTGDGLQIDGRQVCPDCAEIVAFWPTIEHTEGGEE